MSLQDLEAATAAEGNAGSLARDLRRVRAQPIPSILETDRDSGTYRFPPQIFVDETSHDNVALQRRGRFVIKLAATLFLAMHDGFDTPGKCTEAMSTLWGHTQLAMEYLRRKQPPGAPCPTYTSRQLSKAESRWKAALGNLVVEEDGFQRCWNELVPFFQRGIADNSRKQGGAAVVKSAARSRAHPQSLGCAKPGVGTFVSAAITAALISNVAHPSAAPTGTTVDGVSRKLAASHTDLSLDLAKVPARGLSMLFDRTVSCLRCISAAPRDASADSNLEDVFLSSRGWLSVRQVVDSLYAELSNESALKTFWTWWLGVRDEQAAVLFVSLLLPLNLTGELQFLHSGEDHTVTSANPTLQHWSAVTHIRAAWGHHDAAMAEAVMEEHACVPLHSLVDDSAESGAGKVLGAPQPPSSEWFEYVRDIKIFRKEMTDVGGRVYTADSPYQVLVSRDALAEWCASPQSILLKNASSSSCEALARLIRRTKAPSCAPGAEGSGAFGCVSPTATSVTEGEFEAMLRPSSGFAIATAVAAKTFSDSRLAFVHLLSNYLAKQDATVCGLEVPAHLTRIGFPLQHPHRHRDAEGGSGAAFNTQHGSGTSPRGVSALASPNSPRVILVLPRELTYGLLQRDAVSTSVLSQASTKICRDSLLPSTACIVDARAMFAVLTSTTYGGQWLRMKRPPTELLVDLRIASLWDLWLWYGFSLSSPPTHPHHAKDTAGAKSKKTKSAKKCRQLIEEEEMGVSIKQVIPESPTPEAKRSCTSLLTSSCASATAFCNVPECPTTAGQAEEQCQNGVAASGSIRADAAVVDETLVSNPKAVSTGETKDTIPCFPWEFFPSSAAEAMIRRLDVAYEAGLRAAWERWHPTGLQLLKPLLPANGSGGCPLPGSRTGTIGGDMLLSLLRSDDHVSSCAPANDILSALPEWQVRENALWDGLSRWMGALQAGCAVPHFSLLLPPNVKLQSPLSPSSFSSSPPPQLEARWLGRLGRKKGMGNLRRLFGGLEAPTNFYIEEEHFFTQEHNFDGHRVWVVENTLSSLMATSSAADAAHSQVNYHVARDEERWTIASRPEVLVADMRDNHDERAVGMYLRQVCVLQRADTPSKAKSALGIRATLPLMQGGDAAGDAQGSPLRLLQFVGAPRNTPETEMKEGDGAAAGAGGALEEIPLHSPMRHAHCGCRVSPLACDELVLGAAWPADAIVDYALLPPIREALGVYCMKLSDAAASRAKAFVGDADASQRATLGFCAVPSAAALAVMVEDLRRELLLVLTDETAMEQREFYGDGLLDYCVAVTTLSYRHASSNWALWRGGSITEASSNNALVVRALPSVLRDYWMSRRRICNDKRLADCVESLFGALSMALWVLPLRRRRTAAREDDERSTTPQESGGATSSEKDLPAPDADMLIYAASALLQLLSGNSGG